jgi:hypothetical protein
MVTGYFRFRRRIRIMPGVRLNLSKSGVSTSIGRRGMWATYGHGRRRITLGVRGTGMSYTSTTKAPDPAPAQSGAVGWLVLLLAIAAIAWRLFH